jgi:hypothetical protein
MAVMLIDCGRVEEADTELRYLTGALSEDEAEAFEAHFMGCERCWTGLHRAIELSAALSDATAETSPRGLRPRWGWGIGVSAALLIVAGTTWIIHFAHRRSVHAGTEVSMVAPARAPQSPQLPQPPQAPQLPQPPQALRPSQAPQPTLSPPPQPKAKPTPVPDLSFAALDSARRVVDSEGLARERVSVRIALARADDMRGERATAVSWAGGAVRIADSLGDPDVEIEARKAYGAALAANGDLRSNDQYRRAIALLLHAGRAAEARDVAQHAGLPLGRDQ